MRQSESSWCLDREFLFQQIIEFRRNGLGIGSKRRSLLEPPRGRNPRDHVGLKLRLRILSLVISASSNDLRNAVPKRTLFSYFPRPGRTEFLLKHGIGTVVPVFALQVRRSSGNQLFMCRTRVDDRHPGWAPLWEPFRKARVYCMQPHISQL